jgi:peptide deformylase
VKILPASQIPTDIIDVPLDDPVKLYKLCRDMKRLCSANQGKGLSAVQVGIPWNLFVVLDLPKFIRVGEDSFGCFLNCQYHSVDDHKTESIEGCLSLLNEDGSFRRFRLDRHSKVRVQGKRLVDLDVIDFDQVFDLKHDAIVFQHEIDHANQVLISDIGKEILLW